MPLNTDPLAVNSTVNIEEPKIYGYPMHIRQIDDLALLPYDLLYLADESHEAVAEYISRSQWYGGYLGEECIGCFALLRTRPFTLELVNIAVRESHQGQGYGKQLVQYAIELATCAGCKVLEVGTGNAGLTQLALYQKCGFRFDSIDRDFFRKHYSQAIFENGIACVDMIRLKRDL